MKRGSVVALTLACLVCVVWIAACGGKAPDTPAESATAAAPASSASAPAGATAAAPAPAADTAEVTTEGGSILVKGSGSGTVGPIAFDRPFYILKLKYDSADPYSMFQAAYKDVRGGAEVEESLGFLSAGGETARVFQPRGQSSIAFTVKSGGAYTIEFVSLPALDTALPAPQTFNGGKGHVVTPLVKTAGNYVMLRLKYTGPVDPAKKGGMPLASANLYDATTGDAWVRNQNVSNTNTQTQNGATRPQPGVYFAIVSCNQADGAWEVTITEDSSD